MCSSSSSPAVAGFFICGVLIITQFTFSTRPHLFLFALVFGRLEEMCVNVIRYMNEDGFSRFRTLVVAVRFADFETKSTVHTLPEPADSLAILKREATRLLMPYFDSRKNPRRQAIRLTGIRIEKLV